MDDVRFSGDAIVIRRSRRRISRFFSRTAVAMAVGPVVLALVASLLATVGWRIPSSFVFDVWAFSWLVGAPGACVGALIAGRRGRVRGSRVEADGEGLSIRDAQKTPRSAIAGALYVAGRGHDAEISLVNGDVVHIELATAESAQALIEALGFSADARRTVIALGDDHDALQAGCWGVVIGALVTTLSTCGIFASNVHAFKQIAGYVLGLVFVATSIFVARMLAPPRLVVGTDGVLLDTMFGKRFIPIASITDVAMTPQGIVLTLTEGNAYDTVALTSGRSERSAALRDRIMHAVTSARRAGTYATSALVARGDRPVGEWRDALRKLMRNGGYRGESVSMDALLRAAGSTDTPPEDRIGAAMAIGLAADPEAKKRLRIAVDGIANDELRIAMERAAEGDEEDDAAVEEAMAAVKKNALT